jgi:hypothetical protein
MNTTGQFIHKLLSTTPYDRKVITVFTSKDITARVLIDQIISEEKKFQLFNINGGVIPSPRELPALLDELINHDYIIIFNVNDVGDLKALLSVLGRWKTTPYSPIKSENQSAGQTFIHINGIERENIMDDFIRIVDYWGAHPQENSYEF